MIRKQHNVEIYTKDANSDKGDSIGASREKESRYGNKMEANRETTSGACTNIMDTDIDLEPGPCGSDKNVESKKQADSATEIPKTSSKSMKVCTFHDGCKQGIDQQIFNRKSISRKITHPQS